MPIAKNIQEFLGASPSDLIAYFEKGEFHINPDTNIQCLAFEKAFEYSRAIHNVTIFGKTMGLFALDDAEDSNPYCYVSRGPCAGAVLHLHHDDTSTIDFRSLESFLAALTSLPKKSWIDELKPDSDISFDTQTELERLVGDPGSDPEVYASIYLPVTHEISESLKRALSTHDDFFVREAFAGWLCQRGRPCDLEFAKQLASDKVHQVARPASKALQRIKQLH